MELRPVRRAPDHLVAPPPSASTLGLPAGGEHGGGEAAPGLAATLQGWGIWFILFLLGAIAGGLVGWLIIKQVNWPWAACSGASTGSSTA